MQIPDGHYLFGTVKVGERGQIVIPQEARRFFGISPRRPERSFTSNRGTPLSSWGTRSGASP